MPHILAHAVMVHSLRRPAAVQEATLVEYHRGSWETVEGTQAFVVPVAKHKTMATHVRARLVFDDFLKNKQDAYIDAIRPRLLQPNEKHPNLFILSDRIKRLAPRFGFHPATATDVRKAAATATAYKPQQTRANVAKQQGQTLQVEDIHYALVHSDKEAANVVFSLHSKQGTSTQATQVIRPFSNQEVQLIAEFFKDHLKNKTSPSTKICMQFLDQYCLPHRKPQNIQDKVKNMNKM